ncbi:hypothetical protein J6590_085184 [Homalodisca vitripennis]|nr:hypothetical protein J6590_085184 [Homalodisca vitripennis]
MYRQKTVNMGMIQILWLSATVSERHPIETFQHISVKGDRGDQQTILPRVQASKAFNITGAPHPRQQSSTF